MKSTNQSTQINNHLSGHLSPPTHLGTQPKTTTGTDLKPTIYGPPHSMKKHEKEKSEKAERKEILEEQRQKEKQK